MLTPKLTITGIDATIARLDGLDRQLALSLVVELEWFGRTTTRVMIDTHTFKNITGQLERSIGYTVENWGAPDRVKISINVFALAPYAMAVEEGTYKSAPYPFFWPTYYEYLPELMARLQTAVDETLAEFGATSGFRTGRRTVESVYINPANRPSARSAGGGVGL